MAPMRLSELKSKAVWDHVPARAAAHAPQGMHLLGSVSGNLSKPSPSPPAPLRQRVRDLRIEPAVIENPVL